jgi:hypothetical protein
MKYLLLLFILGCSREGFVPFQEQEIECPQQSNKIIINHLLNKFNKLSPEKCIEACIDSSVMLESCQTPECLEMCKKNINE